MNPTAGKRDHTKVWKEIRDKLAEHQVQYEVYFTKEKKDAESFEIGKIEEGYRKFIAIGGDGTVCLLYTSPTPRDRTRYRMQSSA